MCDASIDLQLSFHWSESGRKGGGGRHLRRDRATVKHQEAEKRSTSLKNQRYQHTSHLGQSKHTRSRVDTHTNSLCRVITRYPLLRPNTQVTDHRIPS